MARHVSSLAERLTVDAVTRQEAWETWPESRFCRYFSFITFRHG